MKVINKYTNGNVNITLFEDGTRICENDLDYFDFAFPTSMDCKITNKCPMGCIMCHEKSTPNGEHGDIMNVEFINKLHAGTEMAIGGGAVTGHPDIVAFLEKLKEIGVIPSITVHQKEYQLHKELIQSLIDKKLIYGLGISFSSFDNDFWDDALQYENAVVHLIAGMHAKDVFDYFAERNAKVLILGYKDFGRGHEFLDQAKIVIDIQKDWLKDNLKSYLEQFKVVSFDNLAIEQLDVKSIVDEEKWQEFYQGDDGTSTMYVDLVNKQFAKTSTSTTRYDLLDDIEDMFDIIKKENNNG